MEEQKRFRALLPFFLLAPFVLAVLCIAVGRYAISPLEVFRSLLQGVTGTDAGVGATKYALVVNLRLPRILLAALCGAGLAAAGTGFQALFRNPLATPDTLGVSAGAGFGASVSILLGLPMLWVQGISFMWGLAAVCITYIGSGQGKGSVIQIVLSGIVVAAIFQAMISLVQMLAEPTDKLPAITFWLMGSFAGAGYAKLALGAPFVLAGMGLLFALRWRLNVVALSEEEAASLGLHVRRIRALIIIASTMISASCVAMCGIVGWVGMLVPHISRMLLGNNNRYTVPASMSLGAVMLIALDTLARSAGAAEIPISILTALFGAPIFILFLRKTGGALR